MYGNLEAELRRFGISRARIADVLGVNVSTASTKLTHRGRLKLDEAFKIQEAFFPELDFKYLFATTDQKSA